MENVTNASNFGSTVHAIKQNNVEGPLGKVVSAAAHEKNAVRKAEAVSEEATISAALNPSELLFKTTVEGINEALGESTIQGEYDVVADVTPEALAQKIVSLASATYTQFADGNPGATADEIAAIFANTINEGVNNGVIETKELLASLNTLDDEIINVIDMTHDAITQGVQSFLDGLQVIEELPEIEEQVVS